jgi:protein-L-isoaspartate(D-aspartate) O-methyltransferase
MKGIDGEALKYSGQRRKMVDDQLASRGIRDPRILEAMNRIPRHLFVHESLQHRAYGDHPLPIGESQTISHPYTVAAMTEALALKGKEKVLEIGTGSGYQTAVLAEMAGQVFTIERIRSISLKAQRILDRLGYMKIVFKVFDGTYGWPDQAPFDAILIAASSPSVPENLVAQLGEDGRLVIPVADNGGGQKLVRVIRECGTVRQEDIGDCKFVPLLGKYGWAEPLPPG